MAVLVDGSEWVAIRPEDFERLDACRRQVGATAARATRLEHEVRQARARLARIEAIVAEGDSTDSMCERLTRVLAGSDTARPAVRGREA